MSMIAHDLEGLDQGFFDALTSSGDNPLKAVVKNVEFRSAYTPPTSYTADELWKTYTEPPGPPTFNRFVMSRLKPTMVIDSPLVGKKTFAPYGVASATEWPDNTTRALGYALGGLAIYTILSMFVGYRIAKKQARR